MDAGAVPRYPTTTVVLPPSANAAVPSTRRYLPTLDGLRGIAILLVMLQHFTQYGGMRPTTWVDQLVYRTALVGWVGVDLFFVLSGFLITGILYDAKPGPHFFRHFYIRRALRIFPLYYATLVVVFVVLPVVAPGVVPPELRHTQAWYWSYTVNLLFARDGWPTVVELGHVWSLAVEEQFYLIWPAVVWWGRWRWLVKLCVACIVGSIAVRMGLVLRDQATAAYVLLPARLDALASGALLALLARGPEGIGALRRWAGPVVGGTSAVLLALFVWQRGLHGEDPLVQLVGYSVLAALFSGVVVLAATAPATSVGGQLLTARPLVYIGRVSYGLYIIHHLVVFVLQRHVLSVDRMPRVLGTQVLSQVVFSLIAFGVSVLLAALSWHLYERPILQLKQRFPYHPPPT